MKKEICSICIIIQMFFHIVLTANNGVENFCFDGDVPEAQSSMMCLTAPTLFCPPTYLGCPDDDLDPALTGNPTALPGDTNCPDPIVSYTDNVVTNTACLKVVHRTWDATYPPGSASIKLHSSCQQTIYLEDNSPPTINNCPTDIVMDLSVDCDSTVTWPIPTATDECGLRYFITTHYSGIAFPLGTTPVKYTAIDECGNRSECNFNVTLVGSCCTAPDITCPDNVITCPVTGDINPSVTGNATATPSQASCGTPIISYSDTQTNSGSCQNGGTLTRTWTATDATDSNISSSCTQSIELADNIPPTLLSLPSDITVSGIGPNCQVAVNWNAPTASDNCDVASLSSNFNIGDIFNEGTTTVTYTANDHCGNSINQSFTITVNCLECNTPPQITCPENYFRCPGDIPTPSEAGIATGIISGANCNGTPIITFTDTSSPIDNCDNGLYISRTWTAVNPNYQNLTSSCIQTIKLEDNQSPIINNIPEDIYIEVDDNSCTTAVSWSAPVATDDCGLDALSSNYQSGDEFSEGTTTVIYNASDLCGNVSSQSFNVTIACTGCTTPPALNCPNPFVTCPNGSFTPSEAGVATLSVVDPNCSVPFIFYNDFAVSFGDCSNERTIERTWTAYDPQTGLASHCIQNITLEDTEAPTLVNVPNDLTVNGQGTNCLANVTWPQIVAYDDCGTSTVTLSNTDQNFTAGLTTVNVTATDDCGNSTQTSFSITVVCDDCVEPPTFISCPTAYESCTSTNIPDPSIAGYGIAIIDGTNCTGVPYTTYIDNVIATGNCPEAQTIERTWIATDPNNKLQSTCTQIITLGDSEAPQFTSFPSDINLQGSGNGCSISSNWAEPTYTDNCSSVTATSNYTNGASFSEGSTQVTYTLTDNCGNTSSASFTVNVSCTACNTAPTITCPSNYTACYTSNSDPVTTGTAIANNIDSNCGTPEVSFNDLIISSGPCPGELLIQRTWTAIDIASGLSSNCIQTINLVDDLPPVMSNVPDDITVTGSGPGCQESVTWQTITVTDNCGIPQLNSTHNPGDFFPEGTTEVSCTATDECSNTTTITFKVTVLCEGCNTAPTIICPANYFTCPGANIDPIVTGTAVASNNGTHCNSNPSISYTDEIVSTGPCNGAKVINRIWTATDPDSGLSSQCTQVITLADTQKPIISNIPNDIYVTGDGAGCTVLVSWLEPTATDNCSTLSPVCGQINGGYYPAGTTTIIYTATDACGNSTTASFTVNVSCTQCNNPPVLNCPADYSSCPVAGIPDPSISGLAYVTAGGSNCGTPTVSFTDIVTSTGPCADQKEIERRWTAIDSNDPSLATSCVQKISLIDNTAPALANCPSDIFLTGLPATGSGSGCIAIASWNLPTVTDECSNVSLVANDENGNLVNTGDSFEDGITTVTYTATDLCGNASTCSFDIHVSCAECTSAPTVNCPQDVVLCINQPIDPASIGYASVTGNANCPSPTLAHNDVTIASGPCIGEAVYRRTWTASYAGYPNLYATCVQLITLEDTDPVISACPEDITVVSESTPVNWMTPSFSDFCGTASIASTHSSGTTFPCGTTNVTYTVSDNCNQTATCSFNVIVECLQNGGFTYCPDDMHLSCNGGGTIANWNTPTYNNTCSDCSVGQNIPGFIYMGTYGGSQYYCSISQATWPVAQNVCQNFGGYLASVNSPGENNFLANILTIQSAWIGLTDVNSPGNFNWTNGDPMGYSNWYPGQPNNFNNNQNYCEMLSNGQWNDQYNNYALEYIMEIPCDYVHQISGPLPGSTLTGGTYTVVYGVTDGCGTTETCSFNIFVEETLELTCPDDIIVDATNGSNAVEVNWSTPQATSCCSSCSGNISGFMYMGSFGGHHYYCSLSPDTWQNAQAHCQGAGGNLATINSAAENNFLAGILTLQSAWIGLNDLGNEGQFGWSSGESVSYTNWYTGQPNNFNANQHCVEMLSSGLWNDQYGYTMLEYIMEIPSCIQVNQIGGPLQGALFNAGTVSTITYEAEDACGNREVCSFQVTVNEDLSGNGPCEMAGLNSNCHYINACKFGTIYNDSGSDNGYGDFTSICTTIQPGTGYAIKLDPGFGSCNEEVLYWSCWIDYNGDGDYYDNHEFVAYGAGSSSVSGNIIIPTEIWTGTTTMRIACKPYGYATNPCENIEFGEVEDYCIEIVGGNEITSEERLFSRAQTRNDATELFVENDYGSESEIEVKVYPNPVSQIMNVDLSSTADIEAIGLFDQSGRLVQSIEINNTISTNVNELPGGIYNLGILLKDGNRITEKVLILH